MDLQSSEHVLRVNVCQYRNIRPTIVDDFDNVILDRVGLSRVYLRLGYIAEKRPHEHQENVCVDRQIKYLYNGCRGVYLSENEERELYSKPIQEGYPRNNVQPRR